MSENRVEGTVRREKKREKEKTRESIGGRERGPLVGWNTYKGTKPW